jgi:hypothetical protein
MVEAEREPDADGETVAHDGQRSAAPA